MFEQLESQEKQKPREVFAMIKNHPLLSVLVAALVVAGLFFAFRPSQATTTQQPDPKKAEQKDEKRLPVEIATVKKGTIASSIITTATLDADRQVTMISETNGIVDKLFVDEGNRVREGQVLATFDVKEKMAELNKAEVHLANAAVELERMEASYNQKIISQAEYDKARYEMKVAQAEKHAAQVAVALATIRAPFSGIITERFIEKGQNVNEQSQLFTLVDADPLEARIYLPEKEIIGLRPNQKVDLALNSQKNVTFEGLIKQINPAVDPKTGTVKVTVQVVKIPEQVRPGSFVDVKLVTRQHDDALLVPKKALVEEAGERHVFLINNGQAVRRSIEVGFTDDQHAEIVNGLKEGDQIVVAGQGSLREGSKTEIVAKR